MTDAHYTIDSVRPPAVAGLFYSAAGQRLRQEINLYLQQATVQLTAELKQQRPLALIAPHAGYLYSGPVAGSAYAQLSAWKHRIKRVILLGPAHRVGVRGAALSSAAYFETPLGKVCTDAVAREQLLQYSEVHINDAAHAQEHSLEVQLPFLQMVLNDFSLIPIAVGEIDSRRLADILLTLWDDTTLVVVSSDLSHYHDYQTAKELDQDTCRCITQGELLYSHQQACGASPINGLLLAAARKHLRAHLIDSRNSGDTSGDKSRVVGYAAFGFYPERG